MKPELWLRQIARKAIANAGRLGAREANQADDASHFARPRHLQAMPAANSSLAVFRSFAGRTRHGTGSNGAGIEIRFWAGV